MDFQCIQCHVLGYTSDLLHVQTPLAELKIPLKLKWKKGKYMPFGMSSPTQAVMIGGNIYVGGGGSFKNNQTVIVYTFHTRSWRTLPPYDCEWFGMAAVNNQLVLVGGSHPPTYKKANVLRVWNETSQTWTHPFPVLPTPRSQASVISYHKWLIVAGGDGGGGLYTTRVEILDTSSRQWYEAAPLPNACTGMSSAINGNMWYLSRGFSSPIKANKHVSSICLDELISQAVSQSAVATSPSTPSPWQTLPDTPLEHSTVLVLNRTLLAVGGLRSSAIHVYRPMNSSWVKVGDMPTKRLQCACIVLPSGEIFVAGGYSGSDGDRVDIATIV